MEKLQKNSIITGEISGYTSDGSGVCRYGGKVIFVKGAIAGETCLIKILKDAKNLAYGNIEHIVTPSPHRALPMCPVFGKCGGCSLLHMDYDEELRFKRELVDTALMRLGGVDLRVSEIHGSPDTSFYRNKVIYNIQKDEKTGKTVFGFYRGRTHDVVPSAGCVIGFREAESICSAVIRWMDEFGVPPYDSYKKSGFVRHVFVRKAHKTGQIQVGIVSKVKDLPHIEKAVEYIRNSAENICSVILNVNKTDGNTVLSGDFYCVYGKEYIEDILCENRFRLSLQSFYQVNSPQAERLYEKAVEFCSLTGKETVLDMYCGAGTITLRLSKEAGHAVGCEIVPQAIENAKENALINGIENVQFYCADASEISKTLLESGLAPDVITVDPPRKGLAPDVIEHICKMAPKRVVYVSCDPGTLSRDIKLFTQYSYMSDRAECYDMFPNALTLKPCAGLLGNRDKNIFGELYG